MGTMDEPQVDECVRGCPCGHPPEIADPLSWVGLCLTGAHVMQPHPLGPQNLKIGSLQM